SSASGASATLRARWWIRFQSRRASIVPARSRFQKGARFVATRPFVDTHIHYWDLKDENLRYVWLEPDWIHPILGNIDGLKVLLYSADEFIGETRFQNVSKIVHVQAAIGVED